MDDRQSRVIRTPHAGGTGLQPACYSVAKLTSSVLSCQFSDSRSGGHQNASSTGCEKVQPISILQTQYGIETLLARPESYSNYSDELSIS